VRSRIEAGQRELFRIRISFSGSLLSLGILLCIGYQAILAVLVAAGDSVACSLCPGDHLLVACASCLCVGRFTILSLAPLADDVCVTRISIALEFLTTGGTLYQRLIAQASELEHLLTEPDRWLKLASDGVWAGFHCA